MRNLFNSVARVFRSDPDAIGDNGYTRLQTAIVQNDLKKAVSLIKSGANINLRGNLVFPPLHLALEKDRHSIALALLQAGADVNLPDAAGRTPLHHAAAQSQESFVFALIKLGADANIPDNNGQTPLHLLSTAQPELIDALVHRGKANVNAQDNDGETPLHKFLAKIPMVQKLLENGADPNIPNNAGITPFNAMLEENKLRQSPEILSCLLTAKVDMNATNGLGETLLHMAARLEMSAAFESAVANGEIRAKDANGNNVLHALTRSQNFAMIGKVLETAPDLVNEKNNAGLTPLGDLIRRQNHYTPLRGPAIAVAQSLITAGANPDAQDDQGRTLLHIASQQDLPDVVEFLVRKKANLDVLNHAGKSALHIAIEAKNLPLLDRLLDHGANPDLPDATNWTVLDRLAEKGDRDSPIVQRLIVAGGQYNKQLPLHPELMRPAKSPGKSALDKEHLDKPRQQGGGFSGFGPKG